eukprot:1250722-Rhodomonas_salina.3
MSVLTTGPGMQCVVSSSLPRSHNRDDPAQRGCTRQRKEEKEREQQRKGLKLTSRNQRVKSPCLEEVLLDSGCILKLWPVDPTGWDPGLSIHLPLTTTCVTATGCVVLPRPPVATLLMRFPLPGPKALPNDCYSTLGH